MKIQYHFYFIEILVGIIILGFALIYLVFKLTDQFSPIFIDILLIILTFLYIWIAFKAKRNFDKDKKIAYAALKLNMGLIICSPMDTVYWFNEQAIKMLGAKNEAIGKKIFNLLPYKEIKQFYLQTEKEYTFDLEIKPNQFWQITCLKISSQESSIYIKDITDIKLKTIAEKSLFANISHELRIPLTVLQGYVEILENEIKLKDYTKEDLKPYQQMQSQIKRLLSLVNKLLTINKISGKVYWEDKVKVDMPDIIYSIYDELLVRNYKNDKISLFLDDELFVLGFESLLREAVSNLIYNAIEHNPIGTEIVIKWEKIKINDQFFAAFSVSDSGIGIEKEHIDFLTQRFYVVSSDRSRSEDQNNGSGLGLAIVDKALKVNNSKLIIESQFGEGSTFKFLLPLG